MRLFSVVVSICILILGCNAAVSTGPSPVIIFPGLSASALQNIEYRDPLTKRVWINPLYFPRDKYVEELATYWDSTDSKIYSNKTVQPYPGLEGVEYLAGQYDPIDIEYHEFADLIESIEDVGGGVDAAPYDWRLTPQNVQLEAWYVLTCGQIENLYSTYRGRKVTIVAHSMGNLMAQYFFTRNQTFNTYYIEQFISTSPPWGGAGLGLKAVISGITEFDNRFLQVNFTVPYTLLQSFPCFAWVFPQQRVFGTTNVIELNPTHNYESSEIANFFQYYNDQSPVLPIMQYITNEFGAVFFETQPPVPTHLIISQYTEQKTAIGVKFVSNGPNPGWQPINEQGPNGDGTVPHASLHANDQIWNYATTYQVPKSVKHADIIHDSYFIKRVLFLINAPSLPGEV